MGIDYTFYVRVGYSLKESIIEKPYVKHIEQKFHYEDRFDHKTGDKLKPVKIIDKRAEKYLEINDEKTDMHELINETSFLQNMFDCEVSYPFDCVEPPHIVNFYLELPKSEYFDLGKFSINNTLITFSWLDKNRIKLDNLREKLTKEFGVDPGEPCIFIESWIG